MSAFLPHIHTRLLTAAVALVLTALAFPAGVCAQTDAGALRILVVDQTEAVVPGTTVDVSNLSQSG